MNFSNTSDDKFSTNRIDDFFNNFKSHMVWHFARKSKDYDPTYNHKK